MKLLGISRWPPLDGVNIVRELLGNIWTQQNSMRLFGIVGSAEQLSFFLRKQKFWNNWSPPRDCKAHVKPVCCFRMESHPLTKTSVLQNSLLRSQTIGLFRPAWPSLAGSWIIVSQGNSVRLQMTCFFNWCELWALLVAAQRLGISN